MTAIFLEPQLPMRSGYLALSLALLAAPFLSGRASAGVIGEPTGATTDLHYADLVEATRQADVVIVWEGLPRDNAGVTTLPNSTERSPLQISDQLFHVRPVPLTDEEAAAVGDAVVKKKDNFKPWSGVKFCGGFHANYAIEWRAHGVTVAQVLLCFTCHEARFIVGERVELVDQSSEGFQAFRTLLMSHQAAQPTPLEPPPRSGPPAIVPRIVPSQPTAPELK